MENKFRQFLKWLGFDFKEEKELRDRVLSIKDKEGEIRHPKPLKFTLSKVFVKTVILDRFIKVNSIERVRFYLNNGVILFNDRGLDIYPDYLIEGIGENKKIIPIYTKGGDTN